MQTTCCVTTTFYITEQIIATDERAVPQSCSAQAATNIDMRASQLQTADVPQQNLTACQFIANLYTVIHVYLIKTAASISICSLMLQCAVKNRLNIKMIDQDIYVHLSN